MNFIKCADTPIVFHSLIDDNSNLLYGGDIKYTFNPKDLAISSKT